MEERELLQALLNSGAIHNPPDELLEQLIQLGLIHNPVADLTDLREVRLRLDEPMRDRPFAEWSRGVIKVLVAEVEISRPFLRTAIGLADGFVTGNVFAAEAQRVRGQLSQLRRR